MVKIQSRAITKVKEKVGGLFKKKKNEPTTSTPTNIVAQTDASGYKYQPKPSDIVKKTDSAASQSNTQSQTVNLPKQEDNKAVNKKSGKNSYNSTQAVAEASNNRIVSSLTSQESASTTTPNNVQRRPAPEETTSRKEEVKQNSIRFGVEQKPKSVQPVKEATGSDKLSGNLAESRRKFQDAVNSAQNQVFIDGVEQRPKFTGEGVKAAGEVAVFGGASVVVGAGRAVKGTGEMVWNTVTWQPGNLIDSPINFAEAVVTNPKGVYADFKADFNRNPFMFAGEQATNIFIGAKTPGIAKKTTKGVRNFINKDKVAGKNADPLKNVDTTGQEWFKGDLDVEPNIQTTLTGERANPDLLPKKTSQSPLGLDDTNFYAGEKAAQQQKAMFESGAVIKESNIFDDGIVIPEMKMDSGTNIFLNEGGVQIKIPVRDDVVFGERYVGERTKTDFFPSPEKIQKIKPELLPKTKELFQTKKNKNVAEAEYLEIKETKPSKDTSVQKNLKFDDMDNFIGANFGPFTESVKLFDDIKAEFNIKRRDYFTNEVAVAPDNILSRGILPSGAITFDIASNRYNDLKADQPMSISMSFSAPADVKFEPVNIAAEKTVPVIIPSVKSEQVQPVNTATKTRQKTRAKALFSPVAVTETATKNVFEPIQKPQTQQKKTDVDFQIEKKPPFPVPRMKKEEPKFFSVQRFDVFVKRKGQWTKVNKGGLTEREALNYGAFKVGTTSAASFTIKETKSSGIETFKGGGLWADFYKKGSVYVEKRGRRIKSSGELREITFKGIQTNRAKNIFSKR